MTIPTETSRMDYVGNGATTVYPYTFKIDDETELLVVTADTSGVETTLVLNTDYTVSGVGSQSGGNVTLTTTLASGYALTIQVQTTITQETDIKNQGAFSPEVIEDAFDHNIRVSQMINNSIGRAVRLPLTATGIDTTLANLASGQFIRLSDDGTQLEGAQAFATLTDATQDGTTYGRKDGAWVEIVPSTGLMQKIINPQMTIDQRNAGASVLLPAAVGTYALDRWGHYASQASKITVQQIASGLSLVERCMRATVSAAVTPSAGDYFGVSQPIEGSNAFDLGFGTAQAQSVTLVARVRASVAGVYCLSLRNAVVTRSYVVPVTVAVANAWQQVTVTIPGCTDGAWGSGTAQWGSVSLDYGSGSTLTTGSPGSWQAGNYPRSTGSVQLVANAGATLDLTDVRMYAGTAAPEYDQRHIGDELALCQRYYQTLVGTLCSWAAGGNYGGGVVNLPLLVAMRATPTASVTKTGGTWGGSVLQESDFRIFRLWFGSDSGAVGVTYEFSVTFSAEL